MRITLTVELTKEQEDKLRYLVADWASVERMEESNSVFQIQLEECTRRGLRELHDELMARRKEAA